MMKRLLLFVALLLGLSDKVSRQAMSMSRKQDTQLMGDASRILVGN